MRDVKPAETTTTKVSEDPQNKTKRTDRPVWEAPKLEDVSEQVMAQPYIRFT
jgi:hypothetical protein